MGNLDAKRDWGFAGDYVQAMWLMLQQPKPDDFVIAAGQTHTVRRLVELSFEAAHIRLEWEGNGADEKGVDRKSGRPVVTIDPQFLRPAEVDLLIGNAEKARSTLGWTPQVSFEEIVGRMVEEDMRRMAPRSVAV